MGTHRNLAHLANLHSGHFGTHPTSIFYMDCNGEFFKKKTTTLPFGNSINSGSLINNSNLMHLKNQILASLMLNSRFRLKSNFRTEANHSTL